MTTHEWIKRMEEINHATHLSPARVDQLRHQAVSIARLEVLRAELRTDVENFRQWADALALHCKAAPFI
jgi:hypothetical protein